MYSQLNSLFDVGAIAVYIASQHGGAVAANQRAEQLAGRLMKGAVIIGLTYAAHLCLTRVISRYWSAGAGGQVCAGITLS